MTRSKMAQLLAIPLLLVFLGLFWTRLQAMRDTSQVVPAPPPALAAETPSAPAPEAAPAQEAGPEPSALVTPARDPFAVPPAVQLVLQPPPESAAATPEAERPMPSLTVQGLFWGITPARAIVNDQIVKPGDTVDDVQIVAIDRRGITVDFHGKQSVLTPVQPGTLRSPDNEVRR